MDTPSARTPTHCSPPQGPLITQVCMFLHHTMEWGSSQADSLPGCVTHGQPPLSATAFIIQPFLPFLLPLLGSMWVCFCFFCSQSSIPGREGFLCLQLTRGIGLRWSDKSKNRNPCVPEAKNTERGAGTVGTTAVPIHAKQV